MKKLTLFALAAMLILLAGCKKENKQDPQPEEDLITNNPVVEVLKYSKGLCGLDSTLVATKLVTDGWKESTGTEDYAAFSKVDNGFMVMLSFACKDGAVLDLIVMTSNMNSQPVLSDPKAFKGVMQYVGENFTIGSNSCPFWKMQYKEDGKTVSVENYSEAIEKVLTVAENGDVQAGWRHDSHGFMIANSTSSKMNYIQFGIFF